MQKRPVFFRNTTPKITSTSTELTLDQANEPSNQESLEEEPGDSDTTELSDIAVALQELQQAPIRDQSSTTHRTFIAKSKKL